MATLSVKVTGLDQINARLKKLTTDLQKKVLVRAMKKSLDAALTEAQARAPTGSENRTIRGKTHPGYLKSSFRIVAVPTRDPFLLETQLQNTAYTALWVEYGHAIVKGKGRNKRVVGSAKAKPFMRPTFMSQEQPIINRIAKDIGDSLLKAGA